MDYQNVYK